MLISEHFKTMSGLQHAFFLYCEELTDNWWVTPMIDLRLVPLSNWSIVERGGVVGIGCGKIKKIR